MKRFITILLVCTLFLTMVFGFSACEDEPVVETEKPVIEAEEPVIEYERIKLTLENYSNYIAISHFFTDSHVVYVPHTIGTSVYHYYHIVCLGNITTARQADCYFENVQIRYSLSRVDWRVTSSVWAELDYYGNSHCTYSVSNEDYTILDIAPVVTLKVSTISGYVLVPTSN